MSESTGRRQNGTTVSLRIGFMAKDQISINNVVSLSLHPLPIFPIPHLSYKPWSGKSGKQQALRSLEVEVNLKLVVGHLFTQHSWGPGFSSLEGGGGERRWSQNCVQGFPPSIYLQHTRNGQHSHGIKTFLNLVIKSAYSYNQSSFNSFLSWLVTFYLRKWKLEVLLSFGPSVLSSCIAVKYELDASLDLHCNTKTRFLSDWLL